jgi:hypothetical protein
MANNIEGPGAKQMIVDNVINKITFSGFIMNTPG